MKTQVEYWKNKLIGFETLAFPADYSRPGYLGHNRSTQSVIIDRDLGSKAIIIAQRYETTLHNVIIGSLSILFSKYSGQDDIVVGRRLTNGQLQAQRSILDRDQTFKDLLKHVHADQLAAQLHQDLHFEAIVDVLGIERTPSRHPVFQVLVISENVIGPTHAVEVAKFDQVITIQHDAVTGLSIELNYSKALFKYETISRFLKHYKNLLEQLVNNPDAAHSALSLLSKDDFDQLVADWNRNDNSTRIDKTIHELFQEQVVRTPDAIAVVCENQSLTYLELNEKSNQLARQLRIQYNSVVGGQLNADTIIGLYAERSIEMVIGILAILKAGCAYVPIDANYPQARIDYLIEDTQTKFVLVQRKLARHLVSNVIFIDPEENFYQENDASNLFNYSRPADLAYVIYTSGTTGKPKGVMVNHSQVSSFVLENNFIKYEDVRVVAGISSYAFDGSIFDILFSLLNGKKLVLFDKKDFLDFFNFGSKLAQFKVDTIFTTTAYFNSLIQTQPNLNTLKQVLFGGEACNKEIINHFKRTYGNVSLIHVYGPTENIVFSSYCKLNEYNTDYTVPIGSHLSDKALYVLDSNLKVVPIGIVGELYVGGAGVARGYLNRPELTAERFIPNPFATEIDRLNGHAQLYKTGDLVRWLSDGNIEFIGRNDEQVKIRGHRIELGEVESALAQLDGIEKACVIARENPFNKSHKFLIGYYVLDKDYDPQKDSEILTTWKEVYDREYEKPVEPSTLTADFTGWNSYVTGKPIPLPEMYAWRDETISRIKTLNLGNVLEIGIGSGILMYPLLENVKHFVGLDISKSVIDRHKRNVAGLSYDVELHHLHANELDKLHTDNFYDTIIINSVCQHFPSIMYFDDVLYKALNLLSDGGSIFLGDVCNYDLYDDLIKERLAYRGRPFTHQDIKRTLLKEYDLLISPAYFHSLKDRFSCVKIEILTRGNAYRNELSKYRYDVIITAVGKPQQKSMTHIGRRSGKNFNIPFLSQKSKEEILNQLSEVLPAYSIPDALVPLESFPVTNNGKIDKHSLPNPEFGSLEDYVRPVTNSQIMVSNIWKEVLGLERVGIEDDFFRLGGNSILATQASHRMSKVLGFEIKVANVFELKTIANILESITMPNAAHEVIEKEF